MPWVYNSLYDCYTTYLFILCKAAEKLQMWREDGKHSMLVLRIYTFHLSLIIV